MNAYFSDLESLLDRFDQVDNSGAVQASLAWSFAVSAAQTMVRLARLGNEDDPFYSKLEADKLEETARRLEQRLDNYGELIALFAKEANPEWMPTGKLVAELIQKELTTDRTPDSDTIEALAAEMDAGVDDVKAAIKKNEERFAKETQLQIDMAKNMADSIEKTVDAFISNCYDTPVVINQNDAIRIADKIAAKAATYAANRLAAAIRQPRKRRRDALNADRRLLLDIENDADKLLTRLEHERDAAFLEVGAEGGDETVAAAA
jgi:hypothetical protein